jgi:hypothetical protein
VATSCAHDATSSSWRWNALAHLKKAGPALGQAHSPCREVLRALFQVQIAVAATTESSPSAMNTTDVSQDRDHAERQ